MTAVLKALKRGGGHNKAETCAWVYFGVQQGSRTVLVTATSSAADWPLC